MSENKKILWIHNFEPGQAKGGCWMYNQHSFLKEDVDLYYAYGLRNPIMIFFHYFRILRIRNNYALAHAQYGSMVGFLTGILPMPKLLSLKGSDWYKVHAHNFKDKVRIKLGLFLTWISLKYLYKEVVVMSNRMRKEVSREFPNLKIHVIVDPIDLNTFVPNDRQQRTTRNILFAAVSLNSPVKRYELAKQAFDIVKQSMHEAHWYVMNDIPHKDVNCFVNQADVILLTSTHEGWPNVIKEALACNVPFVATDVSDLKEIADSADNCLVVEADPYKLAGALVKSLSLGKCRNLRQFVEPFEMKFTIKRYKEIYSSLRQ